jgi:anhydro-N-acetylmuramic acid kinase
MLFWPIFHGKRLARYWPPSALFPDELKAELLALNTPGADELHRAALAGNALARIYASLVQHLLQCCNSTPAPCSAIGAHGQTVRHRPQEFDGTGYTLQLQQPRLAGRAHRHSVVADFRSRDVAAGGQGAPLVPAFHHGVFRKPDQTVLVLNIGGISNLSVLPAEGSVMGFDCGPGNALMDYWCQQHTGAPYDLKAAWAAQGTGAPGPAGNLFERAFLAESATQKHRKRDLFNVAWLNSKLQHFAHCAPPMYKPL